MNVFYPFFSRHGIGIFGIYQYKIGLKSFFVTLKMFNRCCLKTVACKNSSDITGYITADKCNITVYIRNTGVCRIGTHTDVGSITVKTIHIGKSAFKRCNCIVRHKGTF